MKIYGILNCDTMQKAFKYLKAHDISYEFHNYRTEGITKKTIEKWLKKVPLDVLLNKKSSTYKALQPNQIPQNEEDTIALMLSNPTVMKRPVLEVGTKVIVGFDEAIYQKLK